MENNKSEEKWQALLTISACLITVASAAAVIYASPHHMFTLRTKCGLKDSKYIQLEDQVAIFLYMSVTGLSIRHVGERFQRSNETISKYILFFIWSYLDEFFVHCYGRYFILIMNVLSSPEFYNPNRAEKFHAEAFRDGIAQDMWESYQTIWRECEEQELQEYLGI